MADKPESQRWRWMTKRLAAFLFAMAFAVLIGLFVLMATDPPQDESLILIYVVLIGWTALLTLWTTGHCVWAGAKGYSPLVGVPLALIPFLGMGVLALYLPDKRLLSHAIHPH